MAERSHREPAVRPTPLADVVRRLKRAGLLVDGVSAPVTVRGVSDDSRSVAPGDLFCAWAGTDTDSHAYVGTAAEAGAVAALVERKVAAAVPQVVVSDGRRAAAVAASHLLDDPAQGKQLVAVTGTNGKTTTVWILRHLLGGRAATASVGTLGVHLPDGSTAENRSSVTTPGPVELVGALRAAADAGAQVVVLEASSHALDQGRLGALTFNVAVFTSFSRDHLDYHGTEAAYLAAKLSLADALKADGALVLNAQEPAWRGLTDRAAGRVLAFAVENGTVTPETARSQVRARRVRLGVSGAEFELVTPFGGASVRLPLLGRHNVQNALAAVAAGLSLDFDVSELAERLATVPQVPGRLELVAERPCPVLTDYAHTPDALQRVLEAVRPLVSGRLIVVFGAGGDRDRGKRPQMGEVAARLADVPVVTSDNPRTEDPESIIDDVVAGMPGLPVRITDRRSAIRHALEMARPDDMVLLAGKGHETYQVVGTERRPFDERVVVRELTEGAA
ncbi:MAG: UDP-N-acetylmuramoyl-L-alanyl-D-glutamate--2,6-diaminopimelate ligase [Gemmatimonadota bacterium]